MKHLERTTVHAIVPCPYMMGVYNAGQGSLLVGMQVGRRQEEEKGQEEGRLRNIVEFHWQHVQSDLKVTSSITFAP